MVSHATLVPQLAVPQGHSAGGVLVTAPGFRFEASNADFTRAATSSPVIAAFPHVAQDGATPTRAPSLAA